MNNMNEANRGGTICMSKAGLAIGGTKSGVALAAPNGAGIDFAIGGILYHKADAATVAITAAATQPILTTCIYLVCLDSALTLTTVKGANVLNTDIANGSQVIQWPIPPSGVCVIGAVKVKLINAATFTAGTTLFDATDVAATYIDLCLIPVSPLLS